MKFSLINEPWGLTMWFSLPAYLQFTGFGLADEFGYREYEFVPGEGKALLVCDLKALGEIP